jgi:putative peptidoglycan lipid II flippase
LVLPGWAIAEGADPLAALAIGVIVGGVLQVVAQWPSLAKIGYFSVPRLDLADRGVREVLRRMTPVLAGVGIYYIDVVVGRRILSHLETGSVSYFTFAMRLCDFPQGIFVMALQAATLPSLSKLAAFEDRGELQATFAYGLRLSLFVSLAATAMFVFLAEPIVVTIFQRGEFGAHDAHETARALVAQGAGIWLVACTRQLVALYYALGDTRTPVIVAAADFIVFVIAANLLGDYLGHVGVSWAVSLASLTQMVLLGLALRRHLRFRERTGVLRTFTTTLLASVPAGLTGVWLARQLGELGATGPFGRIIPGLAGVAAFSLVFVAAAWVLGNSELRGLVEAVRRRRERQA